MIRVEASGADVDMLRINVCAYKIWYVEVSLYCVALYCVALHQTDLSWVTAREEQNLAASLGPPHTHTQAYTHAYLKTSEEHKKFKPKI